MDVRGIWWDDVEWIYLAQNKVQLQALGLFHKGGGGNLLTS